MKQMYFLLLIMLGAGFTSVAKDDVESMTTGVVTGGGGFPHFYPQMNVGNPATYSFRLIAKCATKFDGTAFIPSDSTRYIYSNGRNGLVNQDQPNVDESILFDDSYTYIYNTAIKNYDNRLYRKQAFDNTNRITSLTFSAWHVSTAAWKDSARYLYKYLPGSNKMDLSSFELSQGGNMWVQHDLSSLQYVGDNVINVSSSSYDARFTYDVNNNIVEIQDKIYDHVTNTLNNNQHKAYVYDISNQVTSYTLQNWIAVTGSWANYKHWDYSYNADAQIETAIESNWNGNSWQLYAKHIYGYTNKINKASELTKLWEAASGTYNNYTNEIWEYNAQGLVTSVTTSTWDKASAAWRYNLDNSQLRFYYEYFAPLSVDQFDAAAIGVYPVPAVSTINIHLKWQAPQAFNVAVYNMSGQVVMNWNEQPTTEYSKQLGITELPAGNYIVKATGSDNVVTGKFTVQR